MDPKNRVHWMNLANFDRLDLEGCKGNACTSLSELCYLVLENIALGNSAFAGKHRGRLRAHSLVKAKDNSAILAKLHGLKNDAAVTRELIGHPKVSVCSANRCVIEVIARSDGIHRKAALVRQNGIAEGEYSLVAPGIGVGAALVKGKTESAATAGDAVLAIAEHRYAHAVLRKVGPLVGADLEFCNIALISVKAVALYVTELCLALIR